MVTRAEERTPAYRVEKGEGKYRVVNRLGRILLVCADAASAGHYTALMNEAFEAGYKAGRSDANGTK